MNFIMSIFISIFVLVYPLVGLFAIPLYLWRKRGERKLSLCFALSSVLIFLCAYIFVLTHEDIGRISMSLFWFILAVPLIVLIIQAVVCECLYVKENK